MKVGVEVLNTVGVAEYLNSAQNFNRQRAFTRAGLAVETSARLKAPVRTGHLKRTSCPQRPTHTRKSAST